LSKTTISVRHTDVTRAQIEKIQRLTGAKTTAEVVTRALSLYAAYLKMTAGTPLVATGHTRSDKPSHAPRKNVTQ
jgi:hypothetical protein